MAITPIEPYISTLNGSTNTSQTEFRVSGNVTNNSGYALVYRGSDVTNGEVIKWTSKASGTIETGSLGNRGLSNTGVGGPGGLTWNTGDNIVCTVTEPHIEEIIAAIDASTGTTSDSYEINSDGNGATLSTTGLTGDRTFTFPDASGVFATIAATQTLTNKTLTTPVLNGALSGTSINAAGGFPQLPSGLTGNGTKFIRVNAGETAFEWVSGTGSGINAVVDDTTPQLGGQLDVNGFAIGDGILELLEFTETASAVNHVNITNNSTGNAPIIKAVGDDTNINLTIKGKGTGVPMIAREVQIEIFPPTTSWSTGDGKKYFTIGKLLAGMNLTAVHVKAITAGTTGTSDIQIHNLTQTADMLSTKLTIDSAETGSDTAATPAVIDTGNDDVALNDVIRIDVDAIATTAPKGAILRLLFEPV